MRDVLAHEGRDEVVAAVVAALHAQPQWDAGHTTCYPWIVAFGLGLLHGLGFAGALSEIGLPEHEVRMVLLMFNVGVEAG